MQCLNLNILGLILLIGSRYQTPDSVDDRMSESRKYLRYRSARGYGRRGDDRRRNHDDEETVLDSQEVSSADRGEQFKALLAGLWIGFLQEQWMV